MSKKLNVLIVLLSCLSLLAGRAPTALAQESPDEITCASDYTVQASDSIATIAQKHYGDISPYQVIVDATNLAAQRDPKYKPIADPNIVEVGQVLCLPPQEVAEALLNVRLNPAPVVAPPPAPAPSQDAAALPIQFSHPAAV